MADAYINFFGGVDNIDVSDLMEPIVIVGGARKSASTATKLFRKKASNVTNTSFPLSYVDFTGGCPMFEVEEIYVGAADQQMFGELSDVIDVAISNEELPPDNVRQIETAAGTLDLLDNEVATGGLLDDIEKMESN
jgi:rhamnogalacturonyl hydrolase YesR